jgi:hypothetical protein
MLNYIDTYQISYTSIIFVYSTEYNQLQYLLIAPSLLLKPIVESVLQNLLFSSHNSRARNKRGKREY